MQDLTGSLLIAMPGMSDARFERAVVFLCAHSEEGAMGLTINKPSTDMTLRDLAEHLELPMDGCREVGVHMGGPVEPGRGFVLHSPEWDGDVSTKPVAGRFAMTATRDVLEVMAQGEGPERVVLALGYAGWSPGQLEDELAGNAWLVVDATPRLVFDVADDGKWAAALAMLGVDPVSLSGEAGRA